jgi:hypothetical protein
MPVPERQVPLHIEWGVGRQVVLSEYRVAEINKGKAGLIGFLVTTVWHTVCQVKE